MLLVLILQERRHLIPYGHPTLTLLAFFLLPSAIKQNDSPMIIQKIANYVFQVIRVLMLLEVGDARKELKLSDRIQIVRHTHPLYEELTAGDTLWSVESLLVNAVDVPVGS